MATSDIPTFKLVHFMADPDWVHFEFYDICYDVMPIGYDRLRGRSKPCIVGRVY